MPDTVKGLKEANKALRSEIEELKTQLNKVSQKITSQTNKKPAIEDQPQVMSNDHNKAVSANNIIGKQYDDLDAFRKQATQVIKKIASRLDKVGRSCHEIYEAIEAIETYSYQYNIKIVGVPPVNNKESFDATAALCVKLFSALGVNDISLQDIDTAHRVPKRNRNSPASPDPIICKSVRRLAKDKVMAARSKIYDLKHEQLGFQAQEQHGRMNIYKHLTPRLQTLLFEAKKMQNCYGFKYCWAKNNYICL
jgi:prefoldin subunit 5